MTSVFRNFHGNVYSRQHECQRQHFPRHPRYQDEPRGGCRQHHPQSSTQQPSGRLRQGCAARSLQHTSATWPQGGQCFPAGWLESCHSTSLRTSTSLHIPSRALSRKTEEGKPCLYTCTAQAIVAISCSLYCRYWSTSACPELNSSIKIKPLLHSGTKRRFCK